MQKGRIYTRCEH